MQLKYETLCKKTGTLVDDYVAPPKLHEDSLKDHITQRDEKQEIMLKTRID